MKIKSIHKEKYSGVVYNFETIDTHTYFVHDILVHNCHESSTTAGKHADLDVALSFLAPLPAGTELAIGGGNPLSHPNLSPFLEGLKKQGIVANITVNQLHLLPYQELLRSLLANKLVYGIGVSYNRAKLDDVRWLMQECDNVVFHMIIGVHTLDDMERLNTLADEMGKPLRVLLLGYKQFGFGKDLYEKKSEPIEDKIIQWYRRLPLFFNRKELYLSFDNLAIKQLNLKRYFKDGAWEKFYMGDDAMFTFYVDFVKQKFTKSSTSPERISIDGYDVGTAFQAIRIG